jgi:hypothetical protein
MFPIALSLVTIVILLSGSLTGCGESPRERLKHEAAAREQQQRRKDDERAQIVVEMQTAYNASDAWTTGSFQWTADLQDTLIPLDGRPIVGTGKLADVERRDDSYIVHLVPRGSQGPPVEFVLRCVRPDRRVPSSPASRYLSEWVRSRTYPEYAFVAKIQRVKRQDHPIVEVRSDTSQLDWRLRWVAEGECLVLRELDADPPKRTDPAMRVPSR